MTSNFRVVSLLLEDNLKHFSSFGISHTNTLFFFYTLLFKNSADQSLSTMYKFKIFHTVYIIYTQIIINLFN